MNGYQRILAAIQGRWPDTRPVMLHNFMMAARERGVTMRQFRRDGQLVADCFRQAVEKYQYDGIVVDIDTATLAGAVGVPVDFPEDEPARCRAGCLASLEAVPDLAPVDLRADARVQVWLEATQVLRRHFGEEVLIRGNCDQAPFDLACLMRGPENFMLDLTEARNAPLIHKLLAWCAAVTKQFHRLMVAAGAHLTSNGDSLAGPDLISPALYREFALPYEQQVAACAHALGVPYLLHICGNTTSILPDMMTTTADGLELDYKTDARRAHALLKDRATFVGNLDPVGVLLNGTPADVELKTRELLALFADTPRFILNAGCAIPPGTPPENLRTMLQTARSIELQPTP